VARDNPGLANQTLEQARNRLTSGVTDNIDVVQAQGSVALANDNPISALVPTLVIHVTCGRLVLMAEPLAGSREGRKTGRNGKTSRRPAWTPAAWSNLAVAVVMEKTGGQTANSCWRSH
jgi:hypothetical protein